MEVLKKHADWLMDPPCGDVQKAIAEAIWTAVDELSRNEKYRWHDIRKNPDDLPGEYAVVLVVISNKAYDVAVYCKNYGFRPWYSGFFNDCTPEWEHPVVAWREIEPFEAEA